MAVGPAFPQFLSLGAVGIQRPVERSCSHIPLLHFVLTLSGAQTTEAQDTATCLTADVFSGDGVPTFLKSLGQTSSECSTVSVSRCASFEQTALGEDTRCVANPINDRC